MAIFGKLLLFKKSNTFCGGILLHLIYLFIYIIKEYYYMDYDLSDFTALLK